MKFGYSKEKLYYDGLKNYENGNLFKAIMYFNKSIDAAEKEISVDKIFIFKRSIELARMHLEANQPQNTVQYAIGAFDILRNDTLLILKYAWGKHPIFFEISSVGADEQFRSLKRKESFMAKDAKGMKGYRSRNQDGQLRDKRDDTHMGTIEKQYGVNLGVRSDMHLGKYLEQEKIKSLNDLITGK